MNEQRSEEKIVKRHCGHLDCKGKGSYRVRVSCTNCSWSGSIQLTKGHEFTRWAESCPDCGCCTLSRTNP